MIHNIFYKLPNMLLGEKTEIQTLNAGYKLPGRIKIMHLYIIKSCISIENSKFRIDI